MFHYIINKNFIRDKRIQFVKFAYLLLSKKKSEINKFNNILFLRRDGIGDAVMFLPTFKAIKAKYPSSQIDLINFKSTDEVLFGERDVNVVREPFRQLLKNIFLCKKRYEHIVIFSGGKEIKLLRWFEKYRSIFIVSNTSRRQNEHYIDFYHRLAEGIFSKLSPFYKDPILALEDHELKIGDSILLNENCFDCKKIGIVVGSTASWKNYSKWKDLIGCIKSDSELCDYQICLLGGNNGIHEAQDIIKQHPDIFNFTGINLRSAMAIASRMDLVICTDSGFMHVANAVGIKTLAIFGPTSECCLVKKNKNNKITTISLDVACRPCYKAEHKFFCPNNLMCMNISPQQIVTIVKRLLKIPILMS